MVNREPSNVFETFVNQGLSGENAEFLDKIVNGEAVPTDKVVMRTYLSDKEAYIMLYGPYARKAPPFKADGLQHTIVIRNLSLGEVARRLEIEMCYRGLSGTPQVRKDEHKHPAIVYSFARVTPRLKKGVAELFEYFKANFGAPNLER